MLPIQKRFKRAIDKKVGSWDEMHLNFEGHVVGTEHASCSVTKIHLEEMLDVCKIAQEMSIHNKQFDYWENKIHEIQTQLKQLKNDTGRKD